MIIYIKVSHSYTQDMETYIKRRQDLAKRYSRTLFVIPAGSESMRSHSVAYRYKAPSDFLYLAGVTLADSILVIAGQKTYLLSDFFIRKDSIWGEEGFLTENDLKQLQSVQFESLDKLEEILQSSLTSFDRIAAPLGRSAEVDKTLQSLVSFKRRDRRRLSNEPLALVDSRTLVGSLRQVKSTEEIELMREAAYRSSKVHRELLRQNFVGKTELEVCNWIEAGFMNEGMRWTSYETIVGSGHRSTILHARASDRILRDGDLVLIDAGAEWQGYCADITRVMPVAKTFTQEQRNLYDIVLQAQKKTLEAIKPGETLQGLHQLALSHLSEGLLQRGYARNLLQEDLAKLMPHSTSHWLGLDVHDPCSYFDDEGHALKVTAGMTFTVEPGLYFREGVNALFGHEGLGIRIEDDVVVTETGCEILSSAPKEIEEIEELRAQSESHN